LIKSVLQALPTFVMGVFRLPKKFCESLCALVARLWCAKSNGNRGMH
jgi:hypothetical protein